MKGKGYRPPGALPSPGGGHARLNSASGPGQNPVLPGNKD